MKTVRPVSDYLRDLAELLEQVCGKASDIEQARTMGADVWPQLTTLVEADRADACEEPLEVLRECYKGLFGFHRSPHQIEQLRNRIDNLLADAPEPTVHCQMCGGRGQLVSPGFAYTCGHCGGRGYSPGTGHVGNAPERERTEPAAESMHRDSPAYNEARARTFEGLQADCAARRDRFSFYLGHDEGFELGLSVASVNKLVEAHEPHLQVLRDATEAVRDRSSEPTAEQVAEAVRTAIEGRFLELCDSYARLDCQCGDGESTGIHPGLVRAVEEFAHFDLAPILKKLRAELRAAGGSTGE